MPAIYNGELNPTPKEIEAGCKEFQATWTPREETIRRSCPRLANSEAIMAEIDMGVALPTMHDFSDDNPHSRQE